MHCLQSSLFYAVLLLLFCHRNHASEEEYTISVPAGVQECYFQPAKSGQTLEVDYQVIDGGQHGELDINFHLFGPKHTLIVSDFKKEDNNHRIDSTEEGDYQFCWDNTYSHFNTKLVFFEIMVDFDKEQEWGNVEKSLQEDYNVKLDVISEGIDRVHTKLSEIRKLQDLKRAQEARDRNVAEGNYSRVNNWSILQICVMISVGGIQVIMVRSLFDDKSKVHQIWKKGFSSR